MASFKQGLSVFMILLIIVEPLYSKKIILDRFFGKRYELDSSDNFDNVLKALDVGIVYRAMAKLAVPVASLTKSGDQYTFSLKSVLFKNLIETFSSNVPFRLVTPDGRDLKSTVIIGYDTTLKEVQEESSGRRTYIDRTFDDEKLTVVIRVGDVVATRIYKLISGNGQNTE